MKKYLLAIDDTDNENTRGTGFRSRELGTLFESKLLGFVETISRHQLFFDVRIPYTSQNSSACMLIESNNKKDLIQTARDYLCEIAAEGSDVGLAVADWDVVDQTIIDWGYRAKKEVLTKDEAYYIASEKKITLEGLTGTKDGVIGALAGVGLRKSGDDGRCIWLKGKEIRDLNGIYTASKLFEMLRIDAIIDLDGKEIKNYSKINVGDWVRPAIVKNKITIFVNSKNIECNYEFEVATKDYIKSITD
ncbi:MAG: hypothetical protein JXR36_03460 [Bacteroidales bacterium]|nr:hypothetical protein [Bacteroidales bacterium]